MKNEKMARAMTYIDSAFIEEANETAVPKGITLSGEFIKKFSRYGSVAACALLVIGLMFFARLGSGDVLLYGESISDSPRTITDYMPRSVTHSIQPDVLTEISLPLELEFKSATTLTLDLGEMTVLDQGGNELFVGNEYTVKGKASICLTFPSEVTRATIQTNRGYNIVLTKDDESGFWYVNIDKQ